MARRSITPNSAGRYPAKINVTGPDGTRTTRGLGTYRTQREAFAAVDRARNEQRSGRFVAPSDQKLRFAQIAEQWTAARLTPSVKYDGYLRARLLPYWGQHVATDITCHDVQVWVRALTHEVSGGTVRDYYTLFKQIMADAAAKQLIRSNPCTLKPAQLPKPNEQRKVYLTPHDRDMLIKASPDHLRALTHLLFWTGMRSGEALALTWRNVDLTGNRIHIERAWKRNGELGLPKNDKKRSILIDPATVRVLTEHRRDFGSGEFLFNDARGERLTYEAYRRTWTRIVAELGIAGNPTIHDARHTHAGMLIEQGVDWMVLSARLGHANPAFTMNVYGSLRHDADQVLLNALQEART